MDLKPLHNHFLFQFVNDTTTGMISSRNRGQIIIANPEMMEQGKYARWAKVLAIGDDVKDFGVGDIVLIEPGKWTIGFPHGAERYWKSDDRWVLAIGDESLAFDY